MTRGAIILCGGQSTRMGRDKNWLAFGPNETMLQRVVRLVSEAVPAEQIVCVAAPDQSLPALPTGVRIVYDAQPHQGPLAGLTTGLDTVTTNAEVIFAVSCDAPLLVPAVISRMFDLLGDHQIAAPHDGERWHPLPAVYRTNLLPQIESLLSAGKRSLVALLESADCCRVLTNELQDIDPQLNSFISCNSPEYYEAAKFRAGVNFLY
jgi:molybdenum cofactor guanylyltransferase